MNDIIKVPQVRCGKEAAHFVLEMESGTDVR